MSAQGSAGTKRGRDAVDAIADGQPLEQASDDGQDAKRIRLNEGPNAASDSDANAAIKARNFPLSSLADESAVGKVLCVPELLEQILKHLPFLYDKPDSRNSHYSPTELSMEVDGVPAYSEPQSLFPVQRVNRMFKNTIQGSKILRRIMFLEPIPDTFVYSDATWANQNNYQVSPLLWFSDQADFYIAEDYERPRQFETLASGLGRVFQPSPHTCWHEVGASWRQMRISHYADSGPISVDFQVEREFSSIHDHQYIEIKYSERRVFEGDNTIGDVFEAALDIDCRGVKEHGEAMAELALEEDR